MKRLMAFMSHSCSRIVIIDHDHQHSRVVFVLSSNLVAAFNSCYFLLFHFLLLLKLLKRMNQSDFNNRVCVNFIFLFSDNYKKQKTKNLVFLIRLLGGLIGSNWE
jgi:hypothetical protein